MLTAIVAGTLAGTAAWYLSLRPVTPLPVTSIPVHPARRAGVAIPCRQHMIALSPDGAQMVYAANTPAVSPVDVRAGRARDSRHRRLSDWSQILSFHPTADRLRSTPPRIRQSRQFRLTGGAALTVCPADAPYGMSWGPDGIVFGQGSKGIMRVSPNGGAPDVVVRVEDGEEAHGPQLLPGGQHLLFTLATGNAIDRWDKARVVVQSLTSGERKTLIEGGSDGRYVPTGHIVYALGGSGVRGRIRRASAGGDRRRRADGRGRPAIRRGWDWCSPLQRLQHRLPHLHPRRRLDIVGSMEIALIDRKGGSSG